MNTKKFFLSAKHIDQLPGERHVHALNTTAVRYDKSIGDSVGLQHIGVHIIEVEPGRASTEFHMHHNEEECVYVLSGNGKATIGNDSYSVGPGDFIGLPARQVAHTLVNNGEELLVCLVMGQRLEQDITDYPRQNKRLYRHKAGKDLVDFDDIKPLSPAIP